MDELFLRKEIIEISQSLHQRGFLAAADGNLSYRIDDSRILITPTGKAKAFLQPEDLAVIEVSGEVLEGKPSSERLMHLSVFQNCPQAKAVVHAHPPHAIAWSIARPDLKFLPAEAMSELILAVGAIPFVPYARPGTAAMGEVLQPFLPTHRTMILSRHGALAWGEDLQEALYGMERLEHTAKILFLAQQLGGITSLPEEEITYLKEVREQLGPRTL